MLLVAVVGSGIMGDRLAGGNVAVALLANSMATGAALIALILTFGPISGAHFNPAVSLADATQGRLSWTQAWAYVVAQGAGAVFGVGTADYMFQEPVFAWSQHARSGLPQAFSEAVATFGLLAVIWSCSRRRSAAVPFAVGAYIAGAYWFTSSTSFAGIRPADAPAFIVAQLIGAAAATALFRWLVPALPRTAEHVVVPHEPSKASWTA
jgi:glycerol uptake facilitator-like aquaporin